MAALMAHLGIYTAALGKLARDVSLLMQQEVGELSEPGGGSSAMPNKRNPAGSIVILAAASRLPGLVAAFLSGMTQEHERAAGGWQAEWPTVAAAVESTGGALAAAADLVAGLTVNADRMRANLVATHGVVFAEKAAMILARKVGRTAAHERLAEASREAAATGRPLGDILQMDGLDCPEDYLGESERFRKQLLKS